MSAGVFTNEYDQTYLPTGISNIGAAVVGPTPKGRSFVPTKVTSMVEYETLYGKSDGNSYVPYTVENYVAAGGSITVQKVSLDAGYQVASPGVFLIQSASITYGVMHPTQNTPTAMPTTEATFTPILIDSASVIITTTGSGIALTGYTASVNPAKSNYIGKLFGSNPKEGTANPKYIYNYMLFTDALTALNSSSYNSASVGLFGSGSVTLNLMSSSNTVTPTQAWRSAHTPWVTSQYTNGTSTENLFRVWHLGDGTATNNDIKVSVEDIKFGGEVAGTDYGQFIIIVRDITDTDKQQKVLEQFIVNLDPTSERYIAKVIGDKYPSIQTIQTSQGQVTKITFTGDYDNKSKYIRVEVTTNVKNAQIDPTLVPFGHAAYVQPISGSITLPIMPLITTQSYNSLYTPLVHFGADYTTVDAYNYFKPLPLGAGVGSNAAFSLYQCLVHASAPYTTYAGMNIGAIATGSYGFTSIPATCRKFTLGLQDGFDGMNPAQPRNMDTAITLANMNGLDLTSITSTGAAAYTRAIDILANADDYDINLLVTPGVVDNISGTTTSNGHTAVVNYAVQMAEAREDLMYIFDPCGFSGDLTTVAPSAAQYDTNYAAAYYPWIKIYDRNLTKYVWVPATTLVAGAIAYNDKVGYEWYAPAGLNRGGLTSAVDVNYRLSKKERDDIYEARVNPIASFKEGIVIWGQKTLQSKQSALDRVNVRRLLIAAKKYIASATKYLVFEPNVSATRNKFLALANPYFDSIQQRNGLYAFKVKMDEENNTNEMIDRLILFGQIWLQPTKAAEYIILDFNITPSGAVFS